MKTVRVLKHHLHKWSRRNQSDLEKKYLLEVPYFSFNGRVVLEINDVNELRIGNYSEEREHLQQTW